MTILNINIGKAGTIDVDTDKLTNEAVRRHIMVIGLRNILLDCHANITEKTEPDAAKRRAESLAVAEKKLAAMYAGELRANAGRTRTTDPVEQEALRLARVFVGKATRGWENGKADAWFAKIGPAFEMSFGTADERKAVIAEAIRRRAAKPEVVEAAERAVAARKNVVAVVEVDVSDF